MVLEADLIALVVLGILTLILLGFMIYFHARIKKLLGIGSAQNIEEAISEMRSEIAALSKFRDESIQYLRIMEERVRRSVQSVETVRFNPFKGTGDGGNQSFSTAFLNERGNGVVLSSLYSRERISVFSKPVESFKPQFELTEEETEALSKAKEGIKTPVVK